MEQRVLGTQGLKVSALGLGCMGMSWAYGTPDEAEAIATLHEAIDLGVDFLDTAEVYGPYKNEELLGRALVGRRDQVIIATKFGFTISAEGKISGTNSQPEHIRNAVEGSLRRLGIECIDLLYQHRVDPAVPIEDTVGAMAKLVKAGKARYLGLSEAGPRTLERACAVHPISALQSEYSLFERNVEADVLLACRKLGIGFVPYSPLGRGQLTGKSTRAEELPENDNRRNFPRFQGENYDRNLKLVDQVKTLAARKGATPGQIALAWLLQRGPDIVPIPGTKRRQYLRENVAAAQIRLDASDMAWIDAHFQHGTAAGERYPEHLLKMVDR